MKGLLLVGLGWVGKECWLEDNEKARMLFRA